MGAWDVQALPPLARPAPRQSYAPMAGKPVPSSHEAPTPMEPGTRQTDLTVEELKGGRNGGKRIIQRLNEENGRHENTVLSTWR